MTEAEVKSNMKKIVTIVAEGLVCGYKQVQIISYENKKTMLGKGIVCYRNMNDLKRIIKACLTQVELYTGEKVRKNKRNGKQKTISINPETTTVKRSRKRNKSRRRKRNV